MEFDDFKTEVDPAFVAEIWLEISHIILSPISYTTISDYQIQSFQHLLKFVETQAIVDYDRLFMLSHMLELSSQYQPAFADYLPRSIMKKEAYNELKTRLDFSLEMIVNSIV